MLEHASVMLSHQLTFYSNALNLGITPSYGSPDSAFANDAPGRSELFGYRAPRSLVQSSNVHAPCRTRFMARPPDLGNRNFVPRAVPKFLPQDRPRFNAFDEEGPHNSK
jgi:hypothetical protein